MPGGFDSLAGATSHRTFAYDPGTGGLTGITEQLGTPTAIVSYALDGAGRPTQETRPGVGTKEYGWDAAGRLWRVTRTPYVAGVAGAPTTLTYGYDHAGWLLLSGELLPLVCDAGEYYAYNVTTRLPALDQKKSELTRFETGEIMMIDTPVLIRKIVADASIFRFSEKDISPVYETDAGKRRIEHARVTGCRFREVRTE